MKKILYLLPLIILFLSNNVLAGEIGIEFVFSDPPKSYTEYTLKKNKNIYAECRNRKYNGK